MEWFEVDVTWYAVWLLEKVGLAKAVVRPPKLVLQRKAKGAAVSVESPFNFEAAEPILVNQE